MLPTYLSTKILVIRNNKHVGFLIKTRRFFRPKRTSLHLAIYHFSIAHVTEMTVVTEFHESSRNNSGDSDIHGIEIRLKLGIFRT